MARHPAPPIPFYCKYYLDAFEVLSGDRLNSEGHVGSIPFASKKAFIELYAVDDARDFVDVITAMDKAFVAAVHRVRELRTKNNDKGR